MNLKDKIIVVTGAAGGIGSRLVRELDRLGAICILLERNSKLFEGFMFIYPKNHYFYECDLTNEFNVEKISREISIKFPEIFCLVNMAGLGIYEDLHSLDLVNWRDSISVNLTAPLILSKFIAPCIERESGGLIINIGSGMGVLPSAGRVSYCASKFGLRGMSLSLAKELGIDVSLLTLGSVMTPFGNGGMEYRKKLESAGKKYLNPDSVADYIIQIIMSEKRKAEYELYPEGYEESHF